MGNSNYFNPKKMYEIRVRSDLVSRLIDGSTCAIEATAPKLAVEHFIRKFGQQILAENKMISFLVSTSIMGAEAQLNYAVIMQRKQVPGGIGVASVTLVSFIKGSNIHF